jgi:dTDP-glucose pyrophosphorylase
MKSLILAAGRGKRLEGVTTETNKCMLKFRNRHLIEYSLDTALRSGCSQTVLVVGYRAEDIINTYGISYHGMSIKYVLQRELNGLVSALEVAKAALEGEDFLLLLADELMVNTSPLEDIERFCTQNLFVYCGVTRVKDSSLIRKTYAMIYSPEDNRIYRLIEKPQNPINDLMGTGHIIFKNQIFDYIPLTPINQKRQEKELPDLIQCAIDDGKPVKLFLINSDYININSQEDIRMAEQLVGS